MDTKTPPIPLKQQEKSQPKKAERVADVSLPPLTSYSSYQPKSKVPSTSWSQEPPCAIQHQDNRGGHKKRIYRVLHIGATPLMHACQQGNRARVLKLLKEQEETIDYRDRTLRNALHYCMDAATGGAVAAAAPELVNAPDAEGHTPLHLAVIAGDTQLVAVLLANGAAVNAKDLEGHSVLHWATVCGEAECVRLVLASGARPSTPDLRGGSPLHYAAQCCGAAATAELAVPKKVGLKVLQTLLEFGADVNAKDEDGRQPILWAASAGSVEAVLALARAGGAAAAGTSDKDGLTALHCAASRGHARCVEALVNLCGSQPDHVDDNGCSALHYAATLGHADATALILKLGADPNRQDRKGRTPALCAAAKGQLETLKILTQHGGSLHVRTVRGTGIGHEAVASGRIELIKWLAKKRPSTLDVATHDGKTPLHVAALHGYLDACKVLLDHGAKINAVLKTNKGNSMTPLDAALYRGHRDCAKLIQMHGGTTAQQLRAHKTVPNKVFTAKFRVKHSESSTASDSSPRRRGRGHIHPELYYEERWVERRTRRKDNLKKLTRRDSRSFSEEEVRLSKVSSKKDQKRTRSESARYDNSGASERNTRKKRGRGRSTRHKHEYSDSSVESDSCDYSYDGENEATVHRRQMRKRQGEEMNKNSNETEARDNSKKEDDDNQSVSDDSLEVIVVKKSLEKKCEKVISGGRSKTPRECTKETKLTKMHKRSKRTSKSSKLKTSDNEEDATDRGKSSGKEGKTVEVEESGHTSRSQPEEGEGNEGMIKSRYGMDATDSTSQETVEQVIVTAMVHKDQLPDTPKSALATAREVSFDDILRKRTTETVQQAKEVSGLAEDASLPDKSKAESPDKTKTLETSEEELQRIEVENAQDKKTDKGESRLDALDNEISSSDTLYVQEQDTIEKKADESSESKPEENLVSEKKDESANKTEHAYSSRENVTPEENRKLSATESRQLDPKTTREEASSGDVEATTQSSKQIDMIHESAGSSKDITGGLQVIDEKEQKSETPTEQVFAETDIEKRSKSMESGGSKKDESSDQHDDESKGSILDAKKSSRERKSKDIEKSDKEETETGGEDLRRIDGSSSISPKSSKLMKARRSRPSTGRSRTVKSSSKISTKKHSLESSEECSPDRSAIVAVIDNPEWEDETVEREIRKALGKDTEHDTEQEDNEIGVVRVLPSTSEEENPSVGLGIPRTSGMDSLPRVLSATSTRLVKIENVEEGNRERLWRKQRRDSGGRDSGIEPSPRVSRIPRRRNARCCPNTMKQQALNMETITRDVQISLRRYHLERKIFFQLMELKRLQIRHGRANEHVLVKRQVDAFHRTGMTGPTLGVVKYDRPLTFRQFETFLYEQLRRLQGKPSTPDFCIEAKQCTQKTHRCHHATSAYTSVPVYTYLAGGVPDRANHLPKIESRGRGQMTVEVTHGEEKQVIALPTEKLDRTKRYFVTFTVRGETQEVDKAKSACTIQRNAKSV